MKTHKKDTQHTSVLSSNRNEQNMIPGKDLALQLLHFMAVE